MNSFFGRVGSKRKLRKVITNLIPEHHTYVEAFVGGGSIYFYKQPSQIEVINDIDINLIDGYRLLRNLSLDDINEINNKLIEFQELKCKIKGKYYYKYGTNQYYDELLHKLRDFVSLEQDNNGLKLYQKILNSHNTYNGRSNNKIYLPDIHKNKISKINKYINRLQNTIIQNIDYKSIIDMYDSSDTFFYFDPPYEESPSDLYDNIDINYIELRDKLTNLQGKFILSINNSENIRELFNNFNINEVDIIYNSRNRFGNNKKTELLITNF